jgi:hypothetical protein
MSNFRAIWKHEVKQADNISRRLLANKKVNINWKIVLLPVFLYTVYHYRKDLRFTRKNFLLTKQLAFDAAKNISQGKERAWEFRRIEIKTQEILDKEKKGFIIRESYPSKGNYLAFLSTLHQAEEDVIQAAITTMRKATKKDRREWFQKVRQTTKKVRITEAEQIYT